METPLYFHSGKLSPTLGNDIKTSSICMTEVRHKIWTPKQENKCRVQYYRNDIDDGIFDYMVCSKSKFNINLSWEVRNKYDVIIFDENIHL